MEAPVGVEETALLAIRVLAVTLYTGAFFFYAVLIGTSIRKLPPTHRAAILLPLMKRTTLLALFYVAVMVISGVLYSQEIGILGINLLQPGVVDPLLLGELVINGLMVFTAVTAVLTLGLRRFSSSSKIKSQYVDSKWFIYDGAKEVLQAYRVLNILFLVNLFLGFVSIVLGILILRV